MRRFLFILMLAFAASVSAQSFELISSQDTLVEFQFELGQFERNSTQVNGIEYQNFSTEYHVLSSEKGAPALPYFSQSIQIPNEGNVNYEVVYDGVQVIDNINVLPSKGNLKRNVNPDTIPYTFGEVYSIDANYPNAISQISEPFILRNTRGVTVSLYPFQYNPVQKKLYVYENLHIVVHTDLATKGENELRNSADIKSTPNAFKNIYNQVYLNHQITPLLNSVSESGSMLIISDPEYVDQMQEFVKWKNQSGINTSIVETNATRATATQIKSFVQDYYNTHADLTFILLVGDSDKIPAHTYGNNGEQLWSDSYYGQLAGGNNDFFPEVLVGRLSGNSSEIATMVKRILEYEKNPLEGDWMKNGIGVGSSEGAGSGNDGEADFEHLRNIRSQLMNFGYTKIYEFYEDSQDGEDAAGDPNPTMINQAINTGTGLFNYTGHGWLEGMYTGDYTNSDVMNQQNHGKYPFVISVACNNGTFVGETTLGEAFLRADQDGNPTGAIAFAGSSILMAWAEPMATQDEMTNILTRVFPEINYTTLGGLFYNGQIRMLSEYNSTETAREVMQTWILFGDPSVIFRYDLTQDITASHADKVFDSDTNFEVTNCNANGGLATLSQGNQIIGTAKIVDGSANINLEETIDFTGDVEPILTIVAQNYKPYQAEITRGALGVQDLNGNLVNLYPNPAKENLTVSWEGGQRPNQIEILDISGKLVKRVQNITDSTQQQINVSSLPQGAYIVKIYFGKKAVSKKLLVN